MRGMITCRGISDVLYDCVAHRARVGHVSACQCIIMGWYFDTTRLSESVTGREEPRVPLMSADSNGEAQCSQLDMQRGRPWGGDTGGKLCPEVERVQRRLEAVGDKGEA
jgi:hypothetical protein